MARFDARTDLTSHAPAGKMTSVPVTVQGAAANGNLRSLAVYVSYDRGGTWKKAAVQDGRITVENPSKDKSVSLRADITDKQGNKSSVSVYDAYLGA